MWLIFRRDSPLRPITSVFLFVISTLFYLAFSEILIRVATNTPNPFKDHDFRHERATNTLNVNVEYDSVLGWKLKPHLRSALINTLEYGFISNGDPNHHVMPGGVLTVGSSFTAGSEVADGESWPAQLAHLTSWNVNNAGEGNYSGDQIIMNAEILLPIIKPRILVVDFIPDSIPDMGYSSYAYPKPYYSVENGQLQLHNSPVPPIPDAGRDQFGVKPFLGHFAVVDRFMTAFFQDEWFSSGGVLYKPVDVDTNKVACLLLTRLKGATDKAGVRLLLYLQSTGPSIKLATDTAQFIALEGCATKLGIQTINEYATTRPMYETDQKVISKLFVIESNGAVGHKSAAGNLLVAKLVKGALDNPEPSFLERRDR